MIGIGASATWKPTGGQKCQKKYMVISVFTSARFTEGNIIFNQVSETVDKQAIPI